MMEFFLAGGIGMLFVLVFGLAALVASAFFARRPDGRRLGAIRALSTATVFAVCAGVAAGFAAVCTKVPGTPEWAHSTDMPLIVLTGCGEALSNAIIGFALLAVTWLFVAVGERRGRSANAATN
jgi:hypothetical protein